MSTPRNLALIAAVAASALGAAGCGGPSSITYVDPNGPTPSNGGISPAGNPLERFGVDTMLRANALVDLRAAINITRILGDSQAPLAAATLRSASQRSFPQVEPRLISARPALATDFQQSFAQLEASLSDPASPPIDEVVARANALVRQAYAQIIPASARGDEGFRAALMIETISSAALAFESSFDDSQSKIVDLDAYRLAYGLLLDTSTQQLEAIPVQIRGELRTRLDRLVRTTTPGPTPPDRPRNPEVVYGEVEAIADRLSSSIGIDVTAPFPGNQTPDQLQSLRQGVAAAVESWERGDRDRSLRQLTALDRQQLIPAASSLASLSPTLLTDIEHELLVALPAAMRSGDGVAAAAARLDSNLETAITEVQAELALLDDE